MDEKELNALLFLLDDSDPEVYEMVSERLLFWGESIIPQLEFAWESTFDAILQERLEDIIHRIQFESLCNRMRQWSLLRGSLLEGVILLTRFQYPDMDETSIRKLLERLYKEAAPQMATARTLVAKIKILNHLWFEVTGFLHNRTDLKAPHLFFLNHVVETKKANAYTMAILYHSLTEAFEMELSPILLPDHLILGLFDSDPVKQLFSLEGEKQIPSIYINPFSKGTMFSKREIEHYLRQMQVHPTPEHFEPTPYSEILIRMIELLMARYDELGFEQKVNELRTLASVIRSSTS